MVRLFGKTALPLRTVEQMNDAVNTLYWWRADYGLEHPVMFRRQLSRMYLPPEAYGMCSAATRPLGDIFVDFIYGNCCDSRPMNYYPMLDRLVDWMDSTYGQ